MIGDKLDNQAIRVLLFFRIVAPYAAFDFLIFLTILNILNVFNSINFAKSIPTCRYALIGIKICPLRAMAFGPDFAGWQSDVSKYQELMRLFA